MPSNMQAHPLLFLTLTVVVFVLSSWVHQRTRAHPLANPVLLSVCLLIVLMTATGTPYERYFEGAQFIHFLLGPATVALAVPIFRHIGKLSLPVLSLARSPAWRSSALHLGSLPPIQPSPRRLPPSRSPLRWRWPLRRTPVLFPRWQPSWRCWPA
jgi:hypothetical protein